MLTNMNQLFARSTSILGSNTFTRASEINKPIQFKDHLWVNPGDIIVADADGAVVVPPNLVEQVAQICQQRKEMDGNVMSALESGMSMADAMKKFRG
jgi:regulator of RNase E activity RraA